MKKARNTRDFLHAANKVAAARAKYELFYAFIESHDVEPQFRQWGQQQILQSQKERRKRGKGTEFTLLPRAREVRNAYKLVCAIIDWWVRGPNDAPGLMFFRNEALTKFLKVHLRNTTLSQAVVKKFVSDSD